MLESVSPYALLRASIPRNNAAPTVYDLYSLAQSPQPFSPVTGDLPTSAAGPSKDDSPQADAAPVPHVPESLTNDQSSNPLQSSRFIARRTHYISDIQTRHSSAVKRATFSNVPQT